MKSPKSPIIFMMRCARRNVDGQPMFDASGSEVPTFHQQAVNTVSWEFSLKLRHSQEEAP